MDDDWELGTELARTLGMLLTDPDGPARGVVFDNSKVRIRPRGEIGPEVLEVASSDDDRDGHTRHWLVAPKGWLEI